MCGIGGELRLDGKRPELAALGRMAEVLRPRGPDHEGAWVDGPLGMVHRRLSVIDLSHHAHQPMVDPKLGLSVVFNGTLYNFPELRAELRQRGYQFFSEGDTEVILKAWAEWGEACVEHFNGMFAFALWDQVQRCLFLARDRIGIKPLYYSLDRQRFRFASTLPALVASGGVDTGIDAVGLHHQFTLHGVVPAPHTILKGVTKLAPAHTLKITEQGVQVPRCYWRLHAMRPAQPRSEQEAIEQVHEALTLAVRRRLEVADVPVGVLLSGGLDSSLLVGLLAEAGVPDLRTFSIGFEDQPEEKGNEFEYSDQVARCFGTRHQRITIPNSQVLERLPEAVAQMSEPMFAQDAVAFFLLAEQVSKEVKVVQSGQGADEVFGGYFWYGRMRAAQGTPLQRFSRHYFDRDHDEYLQMVTEPYQGADHTSELIGARLGEPGADEFLDQVLRLDTTTLIVDDPVKRVDNMTMAWGVEARVPFLDHELVELAASLPPDLKLRESGKYPLKAISRGLIPDSVIDRPKAYFPVPALKYVRGPFLEFMREVLHSDSCRSRKLYQHDYVERLLADPEAHLTRIQGSKLWHLAALEFWLQTHVDGH